MTTLAVGAIGAVIRATINENGTAVDISSATKKDIYLQFDHDHGGTIKTFAAAFTTNGTDGKIQYTTTGTSDLERSGEYTVRCYIEMPGYSGLTIDTEGFTVK